LEKVGLGHDGLWRVTQGLSVLDGCSVEEIIEFMRSHLEADAKTVMLYRTCSTAETVKIKREVAAELEDEEDDVEEEARAPILGVAAYACMICLNVAPLLCLLPHLRVPIAGIPSCRP
jgi:ribosomal protein L12E/L44/L45/RPP1/RPP2